MDAHGLFEKYIRFVCGQVRFSVSELKAWGLRSGVSGFGSRASR